MCDFRFAYFFFTVVAQTKIFSIYSCFQLYSCCLFTYPQPLFPFSPFFPFPLFFRILPARGPPLRMWPLPFLLSCIAFAWGHSKTAENLCRYSRPFYRVCPQSTVSEKMTPHSAFRYADRRPAVTHSSTDPVPSCLTSMTVWYRTPTTHRTLTLIFSIFLNDFFLNLHQYYSKYYWNMSCGSSASFLKKVLKTRQTRRKIDLDIFIKTRREMENSLVTNSYQTCIPVGLWSITSITSITLHSDWFMVTVCLEVTFVFWFHWPFFLVMQRQRNPFLTIKEKLFCNHFNTTTK